MQLTITFINQEGKSMDVMVNSEQRISDTLGILGEAGILRNTEGVRKVQSLRSGEYAPVDNTYEEAEIWYGDVIAVRNS